MLDTDECKNVEQNNKITTSNKWTGCFWRNFVIVGWILGDTTKALTHLIEIKEEKVREDVKREEKREKTKWKQQKWEKKQEET